MTTSAESVTPKIEVHVHFEGTVRPATLLAIARRNGERLPADTVEELRDWYRFTDFDHFIRVWVRTTNCLRTVDDFRQVVVDYAAQATQAGAVYLEGIFSPAERVQRGVRWSDIFTGYADGAVEAAERYGLPVRLAPDLYRGVDPELAEECARWAVRFRDRGVVGLGLGGADTACPASRYARAFAIAREGGLAAVPHAGESGGPETVWEALALDPPRIRHGIRAAEDPALLATLAARGVVLDVCPTSNLRTGAVAALASHPLPRLRAAGVRCTVGTDDPAMFDTDLPTEYAHAADLGLSAADAYDAGVVGALCDDDTRAALAAQGRRHFGSLRPPPGRPPEAEADVTGRDRC